MSLPRIPAEVDASDMLHLAKSTLDLHAAALGQARNLLKKWDKSSLEGTWQEQVSLATGGHIFVKAGEVVVCWQLHRFDPPFSDHVVVTTRLEHKVGCSSVDFKYEGLVRKSE